MATPSPPKGHQEQLDAAGTFSFPDPSGVPCPTLRALHHSRSCVPSASIALADMSVSIAPETSQKTADRLGVADSKPGDDAPAVRFASAVEEISPGAQGLATAEREESADTFTEVAADELKAFTKSLHGQPLQERRINTFQFEPFSLPPSRVCPRCPHCHACFLMSLPCPYNDALACASLPFPIASVQMSDSPSCFRPFLS